MNRNISPIVPMIFLGAFFGLIIWMALFMIIFAFIFLVQGNKELLAPFMIPSLIFFGLGGIFYSLNQWEEQLIGFIKQNNQMNNKRRVKRE